jgi:autotransporter-associated beta strand protein
MLSAPLAFQYVQAADIIKADNSTALDQTDSWVGAVVPGQLDVAVFNSTLTSAISAPVSANLNFQGFRVQGNPGNIILTGVTATTMTIGSSGIDLSGQTGGTFVEFNPTVVLRPGTSQTWSVASGASATLWGNLTTTGATLTLDTTGGKSGVFFAEGFGIAGAVQPAILTKSDSALNFAMRASGDYRLAEADASIAVANPSDGGVATAAADLIGAPPAGSYMDVTVSNGLASATAFRAYAGFLPDGVTRDAGTYWTNSGIRFNQPHATEGTDWIVDGSQKNLYANTGVFSLLVTEGVGARNVIFNGGNNGNAFRFNNSGASLVVHQHNTQGDLILRSSFSSRQSNNSLVKGGPGRLIMGNGGFGGTGTVYLNEGVTQLGESNATGTFGDFAVVNNGTLRIQRSDAFTFGNVLSGAGPVVVAMGASGGLTLSGVNTYTGPTTFESGNLTLASNSALGATSAFTYGGGVITFGSGVTTDISAFSTVLNGTTTLDTGVNNVTFASTISEGASSGLVKSGAGTLTLAASNSFTGASTVNGGTLLLTNLAGSATGTGALAINNGATLAGTGTVTGVVTVAGGAKVSPGVGGVGTLTVGGLALQSGAILDLEVASTSSNDRVVVTGSNGLSVNGGAVNLLAAGTTNGFGTPGVYNLFQYNGTVGGAGVGALSVTNPQAGYRYVFGTASGFVTLTIDEFGMITNWVTSGSGSFSSASNWSNGVPTGSGATTNFTASLSGPATVTLDGNRTLGGMSFDSANPYTIAQGSSGTLYLDNGTDPVAINVLSGSHVVSAPVGIVSDLSVSAVANSSLTFSGLVAGTGDVTKSGAGTLSFTNSNQIVGNTTVTGGALQFASLASIGNGSIELNGGSLRYQTGSTADISGRAVMIGVNGGGIDTNGNNITFANPVGNSGPGSLIKKGAGTLTLAAGNTYAGPTVIEEGNLSLAADNQLNAANVGVTLSGGTLESTASFSTPRVLTVNAGGGGISTASGTTLTLSSGLAGTGLLTKRGTGTLALSSTAATKSGGVALAAGVTSIASNANFGSSSSVLGTGTVTLSGGTLSHAYAAGNTLVYNNEIAASAETRSSLITPNRFRLNSVVSGNGTLDMTIGTTVSRADFQNNFSSFNGTLNLTGSGNVRLGIVALGSGQPNFSPAGWGNTTLSVDGVSVVPTTNSGGNTITIGALKSEGATGVLAGGTAGAPNYTIGAKLVAGVPLDTTFGGSFTGNAIVTKVGNGRLTLTSNNNVNTGAVNANAGVLDVRGTFGAFYRSSGADGISGNGDDYSSVTEPTDGKPWTILQPGAVTVAAAGTLAGNGKLGGAITVNGVLRPDSTGDLGGNFTVIGSGSLTLASTATTQFDLKGVTFTGVKSTSTGAITLNGLLKFNFLGTVFNGSYQVFDLAVAPTGAFTGVSVTTTTATETALASSGTVWTGTVGAQSYSFDASTGVLTVTGGATAVTPGTSTLSATAGNAKVDLSWTSASGADTYTVKRALVSGGPYTNLISNLAGTTYSDTTVTNGTTYYYVVQAKNSSSNLSGANSNEVSAIPVEGPAHTALQTWRFEQFGVYDDTGAVLAGDTEDFDGDGLANLLEYALGTNPTVANANPVTVAKSGNFLTLTYPRRSPVDAALTYTVQASSDLAAGFAAGGGTTNTVGSTSTYTDNVSVSTAGTRRFLRLSVSYTAP